MELIENFVDSMYGDAEGRVSVWWRENPGSKSPYSKSAWFTWPRHRQDLVDFVHSLSDKDVCVTTATYERDRRVPEHVSQVASIWMDSDVCAGENYRVAPTWTVATSKDRWQHFWQLAEPVDALRASELVHRISLAHDKNGADQSSWPANKIMRVPGTMNTSHGFPTRVQATSSGAIYAIEELEAEYADVVIPDRALVRDVPDLHVQDLPSYGNTLAKLSADLLELVTSEPSPDQDRSRLRYRMLCDLFREGLSFEEVLSVAWQSPSSRKWSQEDPRGLSGLAGEALKAMGEVGTPSAEPSEPFSPNAEDIDELAIEKPVVILTDEERALAANPSFIDRYETFAAQRLPHDNRAYDRLNAWMLLSMAYMNTGYIPRPNGKGCLNFFGMNLGDTTTGKSSSFWLLKMVLRELFSDDPDYNLGGDASETALIKALHARGERPSFFNSDEASGVLKVWVGQDWTSGMRERITELYDGEVAPLLRSGKGESVLKTTRAMFNVYLAGTQRGVMEYMTSDLFHSGFVPRFIFAIGKPRHTDYNSYAVMEGDVQANAKGFDPAARQMAATLKANNKALRQYYQGEVPISLSPEAARRIQDAAYSLDKEFRKHQLWDMIQPSIIRWQVNVHKAACLLAMDRRSAEVSELDMLHAVQAGEEWFTNLLRVISRLSAGASERAMNDIYGFIQSRGGKVGAATLYRRFPGFRGFEMDDYLKVLALQERVKTAKINNRMYYFSDTYKEDS